MEIKVEIRRWRTSVTQGGVEIKIGGRVVCPHVHDEIKLLKDGDTYYGEEIGGWASTTPESYFAKMVIDPEGWGPYKDVEAKIKDALAVYDVPKTYHKAAK